MVNREAMPLIFGLCIPLILVVIVLVQLYGIDLLTLVKSLDMIYYITLFPILLGLVIAIFNRH